MKVKYLIPISIFLPVLTWAPWAQGTRLTIIRAVGAVPIDMVTPGGKQQIAPDAVIAGAPVTLGIGLFDDAGNPVALNHDCQLDIVNSEAVPFLAEDDPANPVAQRTIQLPTTITLNNPVPGAGIFQVYPFRATIYLDAGLAPDITQYQFVVTDLSDPTVLPDTSFPLDSVMPEPLRKLILVLPGESHYPGKFEYFLTGTPPRLGHPSDLSAGFNYAFIIYGTDRFGNTCPGMPAHAVFLERSQGRLAPESPLPTDIGSLDQPGANGISIAKRVFGVRYAGTGRAFLRVNSTTALPPGVWPDGEREFSILGEPPDPENMIVVKPNPIGNGPNSGPCAEIVIKKDPRYGGDIRAKIFNQFGALVREFQNEDIEGLYDDSKGFWSIIWCGDNDKGCKVSNGIYHFCVEIIQVEKAGIWRAKIGVAW